MLPRGPGSSTKAKNHARRVLIPHHGIIVFAALRKVPGKKKIKAHTKVARRLKKH